MIQPNESLGSGFEVVRGNPTPSELAVVVAVLQAALQKASAQELQAIEPRSNWSRNTTQLRSQVAPGQGQWQAAFRRGLSH